jgi:hypothetical protein
MALNVRGISGLAGQLLVFQEGLFSAEVFLSIPERELLDVCYSSFFLQVIQKRIDESRSRDLTRGLFIFS